MSYLPGLASNHHSPFPCFLSSWNYRHEPLVPGQKVFYIKIFRFPIYFENSDNQLTLGQIFLKQQWIIAS
jgi:hypothetical protein